MGKLSTAARGKLAPEAFALPGKRAFPLTNAAHDKAAIMDAPSAVKAGSITAAQKSMIDKKAKSKLGNFGGNAAKPFGTKPKAAAADASADENHLTNQFMGKTGHVSYK